eukprot:CAMPEP_0206285406 /NCGR_PEP_ID=MMETSP0106_2-20121207/82_1 /ASSEMBLY_ACC=CAM_ASM_000206 /TAXON_ID=81532 /ORGANISM="Acanthoeca-like sp., Strain 10tr" /LENGTH=290 /DNA_ID=CAMNT_0053715923 /DNA_START=36 /DNA_END=908 /DNA_ORIENTATION=-
MAGVEAAAPAPLGAAKLCIGFVGCGTISTAIARGLCRRRAGSAGGSAGEDSGVVRFPLAVTRRNAEKTAGLVAEFGEDKVYVLDTSQAVVDRSDVVVIGLTPKVALEVLPTLKLRPEQLVINLVSTVTNQRIRELIVLPTATVVKCVPLPPVALHAGVSALSPSHRVIEALFGVLGTVVAVESEEQLKVFQAATAMMGPFYQTVVTVHGWMTANGVPDADAAAYAGGFFKCISADSAVKQSGAGLAHLVAEQTPGGLNEEAIKRHAEAGCYSAHGAALDAILARLQKAQL